MSNKEQLKTLLYHLIFSKINVDNNIKRCEGLNQFFKDMKLQIQNDNELNNNNRKEILEFAKIYELFALYELKFYTSLKNKDVDKCLKIIKLIKPLLNNVSEDSYSLAEKGGYNNQEYLHTMNALKLKYDIVIDYEKSFMLIKDIENSIKN